MDESLHEARLAQPQPNSDDALTIDLSEQPDGFYLLRLSGQSGVAVRRLVKAR
ncbi:MAG: T9SS type A sorting domain-containing protein [Flavobacteriales bacterium]|nr:T9SS type A sorting domain-containing protein [Flavobacteriales bacterium]